MQYKTCPLCKAHLDFGEICDCEQEQERLKKHMEEFFVKDQKTNQLRFNLEKVGA